MRQSGATILMALGIWILCTVTIATSAEIRRALLIGNDAYGGANRLPSCVNDAKAMSAWLQTVGYEKERVRLLTDATRSKIIEGLEELLTEVKSQPHQQVLFYYSGHGMQLPDDDGDEADSIEEALVGIPPDRAKDIEEIVVRDDTLKSYIQRLCDTGTQVIEVLDCCYAGGGGKLVYSDEMVKPKEISLKELVEEMRKCGVDDRGLLAKYQAISGKTADAGSPKKGTATDDVRGNWILLAASNAYEPSMSGDPLSAFTRCFLDAVGPGRQSLSGGRGVVTVQELRGGMERALAGIPQHPAILAPGYGGDSPFIPGVFPVGADTAMVEELAAILHDLISLDPKMRASDWRINAIASVPSPIRTGTKFSIKCRPGQKGYLVAFTVGRSGRVSVLFPNRYRRQNHVDSNREVDIPYPEGLQIQPPSGREAYYIVLLEEDPFARFEFGKYGKDLIAGNVSELAAHFRVDGRPMSSDGLRDLLSSIAGNRSRAMAVELAESAGGGAGVADQRESSVASQVSATPRYSDRSWTKCRWCAQQLVLESSDQ